MHWADNKYFTACLILFQMCHISLAEVISALHWGHLGWGLERSAVTPIQNWVWG